MREHIEEIRRFIKDRLNKGPNNMVLGLSGGLDSAVVLGLVAPIVRNGYDISLLHLHTNNNLNRGDHEKAREVAKAFGVEANLKEINISSIVQAYKSTVGRSTPLREGNAAARVRMMLLYDEAKRTNGIVLGTENRTEMLLGYATIGGDAVSDIEPIKDFYKTEVREMAKHLRVPSEIIDQAPSAGLWEGQTDEEELGFLYSDADKVFRYFYEHFTPLHSLNEEFVVKKISYELGIPSDVVRRIANKVVNSRFKQEIPYTYEKGV